MKSERTEGNSWTAWVNVGSDWEERGEESWVSQAIASMSFMLLPLFALRQDSVLESGRFAG